jgi:hypothetical protein
MTYLGTPTCSPSACMNQSMARGFTVETTERTDLSLEFTSDTAARGDVRRQVANICVSCLGLSLSDAERLFDRKGPFLVSHMKPGVELASIISDLESLGVLVRPSAGGHLDSKGPSLRPATRRAALYSTQYGDLLGTHSIQQSLKTPSPQPPQKGRTSTTRLTLVVLAVLVSIGIPSSRYWTNKSDAKTWTTEDFRPISWEDGAFNITGSEEPSVTFRGSATLAGVSLLSQVLRSGNTYSARFKAHTAAETSSPFRIEGEPVFLSAQGKRYSGTTTYTMNDASGRFRTGSARIQVTLNSNGVPGQALITLDLPAELTRLSSSTDNTETFSVSLSPG